MSNNLKIVAVLGPYFGDGQHDTIAANIKEAEEYAIALANLGIGFFCPHTHTRHFEELAQAPETFYHTLDIAIMTRVVDAALFTPRWKTSTGAKAENAWCVSNEIRCFYPNNPTDLMDIIEWSTEVFSSRVAMLVKP